MNNVIELFPNGARPKRPPGDLDAVVQQEDIEELMLLGNRAHEAVETWKRLHERLLWMVLDGRPVEAGVHSLRAVLVRRPPHRVNGSEHYRLVPR